LIDQKEKIIQILTTTTKISGLFFYDSFSLIKKFATLYILKEEELFKELKHLKIISTKIFIEKF